MDEYYTSDVGSVWHRHWPELLYRSVTYISWLSDFALYLEDYLLDKYHNWGPGRIFKGTGIKCIYLKGYGLLLKKLNGILGIQRFLDFEDTCWKCYMILEILFKIISGSHNWDIGSMWCKDLLHKMYVGQWPTFHGPVILSYMLKTIWWSNFVLEILIQWDTNVELKLYVRQWPIFHDPVILSYILKTIWWANVIIGTLDPCDAKIYHIKCIWVLDLHFMVQWFCLISWRLLSGLMLYWRYWFSVTQTWNWNYICRSGTYISWSIDFVLCLEDYLRVLIGILNPCDAKIYQISWKLFDGLMLYRRYWFSVTQTLIWNTT